MALTEAQKARIRDLLGWSARFHQTDSRLEQALSALEGLPDSQTLVLSYVTKCDAIDTEIDGMSLTGKATQAGDLQLRVHYQMAAAMRRGRMYVARIARLLGVPVRDGGAYGATGPAGFAGPFGEED